MISDEHRVQLSHSAICTACIDGMEEGGLAESTQDSLRLNYPGTKFYRVRLDEARGKQRYDQAPGEKPRLYLPKVDNPTKSLLICEGEKKALSLDCHLDNSVTVVGLGGVWNWTAGKLAQDRMLIHDFSKLDLQNREVRILFDSDIVDKEQVQEAERALSKALTARGALVKVLTLGPEHKGIDDWFVAWGEDWRVEFGKIWQAAKRHRGAPDKYEDLYSRVYSFEEMVGTSFPVPKFFVGSERFGVVSQGGITIVHGTTNVGKTFLTTQMAFCIATGEDWLGNPCAAGKTLMFQGELPPGLYARGRLLPLLTERAIPAALSFYNWSFNLATSSRFNEAFSDDAWRGFERFEEIIDRHRPEVIIIDPLQSYHNLVETSNDQIRELFKRFKQMALDRNIGVVLVDHDRKGGDAGHSALRGASAKADLADSIVGLTRDPDRGIVLGYDKVRYTGAAIPDPVQVHIENAWFKLGPAPDPFADYEQKQRDARAIEAEAQSIGGVVS